MAKLKIGVGTEADFFTSGKRIARQLDSGENIQDSFSITFEDPTDALELLTQARVGLFRAIKAEPASITSIAARLNRDRSAVKRDVDALLAAGLVSVEVTPNPGHGMHKVVRAVASRVDVHVLIA
ncbi:UNVERIFIED_ORG: ArsR family transcriptional regulator [Burkholderia sp. CF145]